MGFRQQINRHRGVTYGVAGGGMFIVAVFIFLEMRHGGRSDLPAIPNQAYYTDDDGVTVFADALTREAPFDHEGREAVRAHLFSCDGGAHRWVQWLEKYTGEAKKQIQAVNTFKPLPGMITGLLVKKPGPGDWVADSRGDRHSLRNRRRRSSGRCSAMTPRQA